jgi:predicted nucleic acid-binding Zn ribbon protein
VASHRFASIRELLQGAGVELSRTTGSVATLTPVWNEAVGPSIAKNAQPHAVYGDVLVVKASSSQWAEVLQQREAEICARLGGGVKKLRVEVGR